MEEEAPKADTDAAVAEADEAEDVMKGSAAASSSAICDALSFSPAFAAEAAAALCSSSAPTIAK